jgi:hypothetical protein
MNTETLKFHFMKKIFFSLVFITTSYFVMAQEDTIVTMKTTTSNPAYTAPSIITTTFRTTYPDVTDVVWAPMGDWWVATYNRNNRLMRSYYTPGSVTFNLALPVLNGMVPENIISSAFNAYGNSLYDITRMKDMENMEIYQVRLLENGAFRTLYMDQTGKIVTDFHTTMINSNNPDNLKMEKDNKIKMDDGTKVKAEDNKTKIKYKDQ